MILILWKLGAKKGVSKQHMSTLHMWVPITTCKYHVYYYFTLVCCVLLVFERGNEHVLGRTPTWIVSVGHNNSLEPTLFITMRGFRYPTLMFNPCQLSNFRLIWATQNCICSRKLKRVSILFHAWCWSEISRKTKGKIPDFGHPQVGHINKFHGNLTPALIELISVVIAWTKSWMVKVLVICVPQMHPTSPLSYHVHLRQGSTSIDFG